MLKKQLSRFLIGKTIGQHSCLDQLLPTPPHQITNRLKGLLVAGVGVFGLSILKAYTFAFKKTVLILGAAVLLSLPLVTPYLIKDLSPVGIHIQSGVLGKDELVVAESIKSAVAPSFQWPIHGSVSQHFSLFHPAIDIPNSYNNPILPVAAGVVESVGWDSRGGGNTLIVHHKAGFSSRYSHLAKVMVKVGQKVDSQTVLGTVGVSGLATGSHLHLEIYLDGQAIDPENYLP